MSDFVIDTMNNIVIAARARGEKYTTVFGTQTCTFCLSQAQKMEDINHQKDCKVKNQANIAAIISAWLNSWDWQNQNEVLRITDGITKDVMANFRLEREPHNVIRKVEFDTELNETRVSV